MRSRVPGRGHSVVSPANAGIRLGATGAAGSSIIEPCNSVELGRSGPGDARVHAGRAGTSGREVSVRAFPRRAPRARRPGHRRLPLRLLVGARRVPGGRPVLRPLGLPHHHVAHHGVAAERRDRAPEFLGASRAAAPARAAAGVGVRRGLHPLRGRSVEPRGHSRRRDRQPLLCRELAVHRRQAGLLRAVRGGVAATAHVVACDRGAVLFRVAAGGVRGDARRPRFVASACGHDHRRHRRVGCGDGGRVRCRRSIARVLRHRRPRPHDLDRSVARSAARRLGAKSASAAVADSRRDRRVRGDAVRLDRGDRDERALLPRRLGRVRRAHVHCDRGRAAAGSPVHGAQLAPVGMDRPALLRDLRVSLAADRLAGADPRAPAGSRAERAAARADLRRRSPLLLPRRAAGPGAMPAPPALVATGRTDARRDCAAPERRALVRDPCSRGHARAGVGVEPGRDGSAELPERFADALVQLHAAVELDAKCHVRSTEDRFHLGAR